MKRSFSVLAAGLVGLILTGCACCGPCWFVCETGRDAVQTTGRIAGGGLKVTGRAVGGSLRLTGQAARGSLKLTGRAAGGLLAETDGFGHRTADRLRGSEQAKASQEN